MTDEIDRRALDEALVAVVGSGHALLHHLDPKNSSPSNSNIRASLVDAALRLIDLVRMPEECRNRLQTDCVSNRTSTSQQPSSQPASLVEMMMAEERNLNCPRISLAIPRATHEPVIIIGAGIGGLCLAQGLKKAGRDFRIFERDASLCDRPQGYRLKIERDGAQALSTALTDDCFQAFKAACAITTSGQTEYNPLNGNITKSRSGSGLAGHQGLHATYTVDRAVFRRVLMTGIAENVRFGKQLNFYELINEGRSVLATFADGSRAQGSFLIGADGTRSSVRRQMLPELRFRDTGAICIYGKTPITPALQAEFPAKAMRWMTTFVDRAPIIQSILIGDSPLTLLSEPIRFSPQSRATMQLPDDYIYWAMIGRRELFTDGPSADVYSTSEAADLSIELTKEWDGSMNALLRLQDVEQCSAVPVVSATPDVPPWPPSNRITLLGDAIHATSPCGGVGANTALVDAAALATIFDGLSHGLDPTPETIGDYESSMRKRALGAVMRSYVGSQKLFGQRPFGECPTVK